MIYEVEQWPAYSKSVLASYCKSNTAVCSTMTPILHTDTYRIHYIIEQGRKVVAWKEFILIQCFQKCWVQDTFDLTYDYDIMS